MKCQKCGYEVDTSMKFCPICGGEVLFEQQNPAGRKCGNCGTELEEGVKFCPKCGQRTGQVQENAGNPQIAANQLEKNEPIIQMGQNNVRNDNGIEQGQTLVFQADIRTNRRFTSISMKSVVSILDTGIKYTKYKDERLIEDKLLHKSDITSARVRTFINGWNIFFASMCLLYGIFGSNPLWFLPMAFFIWRGYGKEVRIETINGEKIRIPISGITRETGILLAVCNSSK